MSSIVWDYIRVAVSGEYGSEFGHCPQENVAACRYDEYYLEVHRHIYCDHPHFCVLSLESNFFIAKNVGEI